CFDWTYQFARCVLAVLTGNGLKESLGIALVTFEVTIDTKPMHLSRMHYFFFANNWNVVFSLTGHNTGVAASARGRINRHAPRVVRIGPAWIQRNLTVR